jgi:hypothetical protein
MSRSSRSLSVTNVEGGKRAAGAAKGRELHVIPGRRWPLQDTRKWAVRWVIDREQG